MMQFDKSRMHLMAEGIPMASPHALNERRFAVGVLVVRLPYFHQLAQHITACRSLQRLQRWTRLQQVGWHWHGRRARR